MKNLLISFLFLLTYSLGAQTVTFNYENCSVELVECTNCNPLNQATEIFTGFEVNVGGVIKRLYHPVQVTWDAANNIRMRDIFGNEERFMLNQTVYGTITAFNNYVTSVACSSGGTGATIASVTYTNGVLSIIEGGITYPVNINEVSLGSTAFVGAAGTNEVAVDTTNEKLYFNKDGNWKELSVSSSGEYYDAGSGFMVGGVAGIVATEGADGVFTITVPDANGITSYYKQVLSADDVNASGGVTVSVVYTGATHTTSLFDMRSGVYQGINNASGQTVSLDQIGVNVTHSIPSAGTVRAEFGSLGVGGGVKAML